MSLSNYRLFVSKKSGFDVEAKALCNDLQQNLHIKNLQSIALYNVYDVFNISEAEVEKAKFLVFAEKVVDDVFYTLDLADKKFLAIETVAGQYNQRADSALQCLRLIGVEQAELNVVSSKLLVFSGDISEADLLKIKEYCINPVETYEKDLDKLEYTKPQISQEKVFSFTGFTDFDEDRLALFRAKKSLAMTNADLLCIQQYFQAEGRNPTETEIKVLDTYWSDHCRHTTFETIIEDIQIEAGQYQGLFQQTLNEYYKTREFAHAEKLANKPVTLMDLATICGRNLRKEGKLSDVEFSDEINACSLFVDIKIDGKDETWSLQFKNETHNHPTEIEPYGGASTCVGGAIRDPLSGRSYVYQAMRISGSANPLEKIEDTLKGKLPQKIITTKAAQGFAGYGNQIGLATTHVAEIYHEGYKAKRMEVGMVVGAAPYSNIRREKPQAGDVIILLGGETGRDGCGGATGSSKEQDASSKDTCGAEVQKGNAVVERKIQRLFRNSEVTRLIKKCNDFGAGGVCVAVGELADGLEIDLNAVPTKYDGLNGTELAISESQERMAVVVEAKDVEKFTKLANIENLSATVIAKVTEQAHMVMHYNGQKIVDLARSFLDTNGAKSYAKLAITQPQENILITHKYAEDKFEDKLAKHVVKLNICTAQGLVENFDATIGATTVLMPFGGKNQLTPAQVSVQKFPIINGTTDNASMASWGYDPYVSSASPFHGAMFAVIDSIAKVVAAGGDYNKIKFSFQEYFEKLGSNPQKWGKPFAALLGAFKVQSEFELAAIGGKDSMSGTFNNIHVPPTLISFACLPILASEVISNEFKSAGNNIYVYIPSYDKNTMPDFTELKTVYANITKNIRAGKIISAMSITHGGIAECLVKMGLGNSLGFAIENNEIDVFTSYYGGIVFEVNSAVVLPNVVKLGLITEQNNQTTAKAIASTLEPIFPAHVDRAVQSLIVSGVGNMKAKANVKIAKPRIIVPNFPGSNCEYDSVRVFNQAGGIANNFTFRNRSTQDINDSVDELAKHINSSQILMLPGGFSAGDEPDGSAKFITAILHNAKIKDVVHELLARDGLILGVCNGFQALVKSGLLPYGEIREVGQDAPTLTYNLIGRHISMLARTKVTNNQSPWLNSFANGQTHNVAMSHGEGRFVVSEELARELFANGQVACQYVDLDDKISFAGKYNPNGSDFAVEALTSKDGRILGKMGHSERKGKNLYKNIYEHNGARNEQDIFANGVNYFL